MKYYINRNKYFITFIISMIVITLLSFGSYFYQEFAYVKQYRKIEPYCLKKEKPDDKLCSMFKSDEDIINFLDNNDPIKRFKQYDAISLTFTVIQNSMFSALQFFSPLLIMFSVVGTLHVEYSSGMFKNYLLRMDYKKYIKEKYKIVLKTALVIPLTMIFIFILACLITRFNFDIAEETKAVYVYKEWRYSNFLLYGLVMCVIQFLISIFYGNIGVFYFKNGRNRIVAIIISYLMFLAIYLFIYIVLYAKIINQILGFKNLTEMFSITGYWFFDVPIDCLRAFILAFILQLVSTIFVYVFYSKKRRLISAYEKQMA